MSRLPHPPQAAEDIARDFAAFKRRLARRAALWFAATLVLSVLSAWLMTAAHAQGAGIAGPGLQLPPPAAARWRAELLRAAHTEWGLNAPVALLAAQVHAESAWRPDAVSRVGAAGLAQFMPATATWWCGVAGVAAADCLPHNPRWALRAMVGYDRWLHARLASAGPEPERWWATLRAYNGGLGHWQAEARAAGSSTRTAVDAACGSARRHVSHCAENLAYPQRIMVVLQPRYLAWGPGVPAPAGNAGARPVTPRTVP